MNTFCNPAKFLGIQCKIPVPPEAAQEMCTLVVEETSPRECWIGDDFAKIMDNIYIQIGSPGLTLENAWEVFTTISDVIHTLS